MTFPLCITPYTPKVTVITDLDEFSTTIRRVFPESKYKTEQFLSEIPSETISTYIYHDNLHEIFAFYNSSLYSKNNLLPITLQIAFKIFQLTYPSLEIDCAALQVGKLQQQLFSTLEVAIYPETPKVTLGHAIQDDPGL